jgi:uncharacterized protein
MTDQTKLLLIFVNETDTWHDTRLYQALVHLLRRLHVAGATAQVGMLGYGRHIRPGHKGSFGMSDDRPVTISAVDDESRIRAALPELRRMVPEGMMVLMDVEVVPDTPATSQPA